MGRDSKIEWTDHTFNPWWGCVEVSPACDHCYAREFAKRLGYAEDGTKFPIWGAKTPRRFFGDKHWAMPLEWNREAELAGERKSVFCLSMGDLMEEHPELNEQRERLYPLVRATLALDWLFLTKRPQDFGRCLPAQWIGSPRPNVWGMTTVESEKYAWRMLELLGTPFALRAVSYEPALGPVDFAPFLHPHHLPGRHLRLEGALNQWIVDVDGAHVMWRGIDWLIVGGESGSKARPMDPAWVRSARDECARARVPFLFKQWGAWAPVGFTNHISPNLHTFSGGQRMERVGKKAAGRLLDGRLWDERPQLVTV